MNVGYEILINCWGNLAEKSGIKKLRLGMNGKMAKTGLGQETEVLDRNRRGIAKVAQTEVLRSRLTFNMRVFRCRNVHTNEEISLEKKMLFGGF